MTIDPKSLRIEDEGKIVLFTLIKTDMPGSDYDRYGVWLPLRAAQDFHARLGDLLARVAKEAKPQSTVDARAAQATVAESKL